MSRMPNPPVPKPAHEGSLLAGLLSYLVPGLGQIYQGRVGKGLLFMVCLYGLFFYGMYLGSWSNVYLPDTIDQNPFPFAMRVPRPVGNVYNHLQFLGQFWIGVAAWPAIYQYDVYDPKEEKGPIFGNFERTPYENRAQPGSPPYSYHHEGPADSKEPTLNELQTNGDKTWDLGWVYTVIAGVLNILVIYDALAGPAFAEGEKQQQRPQQPAAAA